jgi:hypothetical protein
MTAARFYSSMTGRTATWPTPAPVTPGASNTGWLNLDFHEAYLGLYN